jgi:hypothetical protein
MGRKGIARSIIIRDRRQVSSDRVIVFCHEKPIFVVIAALDDWHPVEFTAGERSARRLCEYGPI